MLLLIILMVVGMGWCANTGTLWKYSITIYGQKTAQSRGTLEFFFPFHAYSLKLKLYFRHSIPDTVHPYKYDMFFIGCFVGVFFNRHYAYIETCPSLCQGY